MLCIRNSSGMTATTTATTTAPATTTTESVDASMRTLRLAITANPNDPFAWYALGARCYAKKLPSEALQCFEKAETIKRGFSAANYYYMALAQRQLGRMSDCTDSLKKAVGIRAINAVDKKARALSAKVLGSLESKGRSLSPKT